MSEVAAKPDADKAKLSRLEEYDSTNRSPLKPIALVTSMLLSLAWIVGTLLVGDGLLGMFELEWVTAHKTRWLYERHVFVLYGCGFIAWWVVYLGSRMPNDEAPDRRFKVKSLRRLLGMCSVQWKSFSQDTQHASHEQNEQANCELKLLEENYRNKAKSTMTTIAILVAVSAMELQEVSKLLTDFLAKQTEVGLSWQIAVLLLSVLCAVVAFISYIISADALDVIFNNFVDEDSRHRIIRKYYQSTITPRYVALISLISSFILMIAYYSPLAASISIGLIFVIGYAHWFPNFNMTPVPIMSRVMAGFGKLVLVSLPFLPVILGWRC